MNDLHLSFSQHGRKWVPVCCAIYHEQQYIALVLGVSEHSQKLLSTGSGGAKGGKDLLVASIGMYQKILPVVKGRTGGRIVADTPAIMAAHYIRLCGHNWVPRLQSGSHKKRTQAMAHTRSNAHQKRRRATAMATSRRVMVVVRHEIPAIVSGAST